MKGSCIRYGQNKTKTNSGSEMGALRRILRKTERDRTRVENIRENCVITDLTGLIIRRIWNERISRMD